MDTTRMADYAKRAIEAGVNPGATAFMQDVLQLISENARLRSSVEQLKQELWAARRTES